MKREWTIYYFTDEKLYSCTLDDITGNGSTQLFNNVD